MRAVAEIANGRATAYEVRNNGVKSIVVTTCETADVNGRSVAVFYDAGMNVLIEPSTFMLRELGFSAENTREQAASALKLLCSYASIIGVPVASFGGEEARGFVRFARGTMGEGASWSFRGLTNRSETTINAYLRTVRHYVRYLGVRDSPFLDKAARRSEGEKGSPGSCAYAVSARSPEDLKAPPYVSRAEYASLREAIGEDTEDTNPAMLIVRLGFEHGLRIGEILGLTLEDLQVETCADGCRRFFLVLRDRVSDRADQHAKTVLVKPRSREDYGSGSYRTRDVGFQKVYISEDLYFAIDEYVEATRSAFSGKQLAASAADSVGGDWSLEGNQYVFLNSKGRRLTSGLWNKRLRAYFTQAGIRVDQGRRESNLNHRLRHGFAMVIKRDLGVDDLTAKTLMRHRSLKSMQPYLKPTDEDVSRMYAAVIADLKDLLLGEGSRP